MPEDLQGLVSKALGKIDKSSTPTGNVGGMQTYTPDEFPQDPTNYLYNPPIPNFPGPKKVESILPPMQTKTWQDWIEKNVFTPAFGPYQSPAKNVPGRENLFKAAKSEGQQFIHDMSALGATTLQHLNRVNPLLMPGGGGFSPMGAKSYFGYTPITNDNISPLSKEDVEYLEKAVPHIIGYPIERYARPALHEKDYMKDVLLPYAKNQPIQTALDFMPAVPKLKGAVSMANKATKGKLLKPIKDIGQAVKVAGTQALTSLPMIGNEWWASQAVKNVVGKLSPREMQELRALEGKLLTAQSKISPAERDLIPAALERTDPQLSYLLDKPEVQSYAALQEKFEQKYFNALLKRGLIGKEDWLATRVFPRWLAAVERGEIDFPAKGWLRAEDAHMPEIQRELVKYARQLAQSEGTKAFAGSYNPITFKGDIAKHRRGELPPAGELEKSVTGQRQAAALQETEIAGKEVTGLRGPQHSMDAALNMSRKLDLTARLLKIYDSIEDAQAVLETLPPEVRALASRKLDALLIPLLREAGITKETLGNFEKFGEWAVSETKNLKLRDGIANTLKNVGTVGEGLLKAAEFLASIQRQLSILGDFAWPHLLHLQQWLIYGGTGLRERNIVNFLIAAKISQDERVFARIPREFLEHRGRIEYKHPALGPINNFMQLLSDYAQSGYDAANKVRGAAAILQMLDEYDKLHPFAQGKVLEQLKKQFELENRLRAFLQTKRALEGGFKAKKGRKSLGLMGQSNAEWEQLVKDIVSHNRDVYGHYQGPYNTAMRVARATSIWANMTKHAITLTMRMAMENPEKLMFLRAAAQQIGAQQIQDAKAAGIPDWAIKLGVVPTGKKAPDGYVQVQFDSGFNLLLESLRAGLNLADVMERIFTPEEEGPEGSLIDAQLNFLFTASAIWSGHMPYGHRDIKNPYHANVEHAEYNMLKMAKKYGHSQPSRMQMQKDVVKEPFDSFLQKVLVTTGLGLSPKKWNYLKRLDGFIRGYEPSDVTVPFVPGMAYPKIDMKHGRLRPPQAESLLEAIPGAHRINEQRIKQKEIYPKPKDYYRKKQMSNERKARLKYEPLVGLLRSKEVSSKLLPRY